MPLDLVQIDAFSDRPFGGNPAAVCLLPTSPEDSWMQAVAAEVNLAETAFLVPSQGGWRLRWFSPETEVELCGHATLAAAHFLYTECDVDDTEPLRFVTLSGALNATRSPDGWIELDLPADVPVEVDPPDGLLASLGLDDGTVAVSRGRFEYLVEVVSADLVRAIEPDLVAMRGFDSRGVVVTSVGEGLYDIVSRVFAPAIGVPEDPVTGSAHCALGPYWAERLGKNDLLAHQASARGGIINVGVRDDRVLLGGRATTVLRSTLDDRAMPRRSTETGRGAAVAASI